MKAIPETITIVVVVVCRLVPASYAAYVPTKTKNNPKTKYVF
tara:strand:- start:907 stop:1032 length:126 start_codon:yes stop_codon:yes gene_type:complete